MEEKSQLKGSFSNFGGGSNNLPKFGELFKSGGMGGGGKLPPLPPLPPLPKFEPAAKPADLKVEKVEENKTEKKAVFVPKLEEKKIPQPPQLAKALEKKKEANPTEASKPASPTGGPTMAGKQDFDYLFGDGKQ